MIRDLMDVNEAAQQLDIPPRHLRLLIRSGAVAIEGRFGRTYLLSAKEVKRVQESSDAE